MRRTRRKRRAPRRAKSHQWISTSRGCTLRSGIFIARVVQRHPRARAMYSVRAPRFRGHGSAKTIAQARRAAARLIAQGHRALAADVLRAR
jgi:hypothetical protein